MSERELAIVHAALSEGHALAPRLTAETFVNAFAHMEQIAQERGPITEPDDPTMPEDVFVQFEGEWCRWGDMMLADRKAYLMGQSYPY